jgi:hypothetical protein
MSEAPERIWAFPIKDWFRGGCSTHKIIGRKYARDVEYIRADIHEARVKELEAQLVAQNPEIKGLRALQGVTYVSVSDKNGRMDDDLFEHVEAQNRIAEVHVGETIIDRIPDIDWIDQDTADWEIAVGKLKENKT